MLAPTSVQPDVDHVDQVTDDALAQLLDAGRAFPSPDLVAAAAALHVDNVWDQHPDHVLPPSLQLEQDDHGVWVPKYRTASTRQEGRDFVLAVAAGAVGLRLLDHERRQATAGAARPPAPSGRLDPETGEWIRPPRSRVITSWSRRSRARMTRRLAELDYSDLFSAGRAPVMLTLTYPGDWLTVAPGPEAVRDHRLAFFKRWARKYGPVSYLWKLEFQDRRPDVRRTDLHGHLDDGRAPHFHIFVTPPADVAQGDFHRWVSATWAAVVGHPDVEERRKHEAAGTRVDRKEGIRAKDPKRLAVYFTKHGGAAGGKEYQHRMPLAWRLDVLGYDAALGYAGPAQGGPRFWGNPGVPVVRREVYVSKETYVRFRRALRKHSEAQQLRRTVRVPRGVDRRTGEVTYRTVTRSKRHLAAGGMNGGFLLVNDGPALAAALARWTDPAPRFLP